jgi:PAS domain S-box-containing protein
MSAVAELTWTSQETEPQLAAVLRTAPLGIAECEPTGAITALNPAFEQLTRIVFERTRSHHLLDLIAPDDRDEFERSLRELLEGRCENFQFGCKSAGGSGPLRWNVWKISAANGLRDRLMASVEQFPDSSGADQRLRQAARLEAVGRLAGGVAHDFNNLLTGILLYCDLLMSSMESSHRARKYAEEIRTASLQAGGLVRQLLALTRPTNLQPRLLSINEIAEGVRHLLTRLIGPDIELQLRLDPALGMVQMDPTQAQQILLNLVLNSRDAMPQGGRIIVETRNCKMQILTDSEPQNPASLACAMLAVEDTGSGMDAHTRAHLFEPFFTTKGGKGTGLGLANVHEIVTTSGGLAHVSSAPGRGTRISIFLPLAPETVTSAENLDNFCPVKNGEVLSSAQKE